MHVSLNAVQRAEVPRKFKDNVRECRNEYRSMQDGVIYYLILFPCSFANHKPELQKTDH